MEVAEGSLEFFTVRLAWGRQKGLDENDKIVVRKWLFEKMNRAEAGRPFAMRGQMHIGQHDGARVWVAGAQVVEKILSQIGSGIHVEHEKVWPIVQDQELGLLQI